MKMKMKNLQYIRISSKNREKKKKVKEDVQLEDEKAVEVEI